MCGLHRPAGAQDPDRAADLAAGIALQVTRYAIMRPMPDIPPEILSAFDRLDPELRGELIAALEPVSAELGDRESAVLQRLANGIADDAPVVELNAFIRLLPVTVSRAVQPALEPVTAAK